MSNGTEKKILVTGGSGFIGSYLIPFLSRQGWEVLGSFCRHCVDGNLIPLNVCDKNQLLTTLNRIRPDIIIHCAALTNVQECEKNKDTADEINITAPELIARYCSDFGARMIFMSTDLVFSGEKPPYHEQAPTDPVNYYGQTKARAEEKLLEYPRVTIIRTSLNYGYQSPFIKWMFKKLEEEREIPLFVDEFRNAIYGGDFVRVLLPLLRCKPRHRIYHIAASRSMNRYEWGILFFRQIGLDKAIEACKQATAASFPAPRPLDVTLETTLYEDEFDIMFPTPQESLYSFLEQEKTFLKTLAKGGNI